MSTLSASPYIVSEYRPFVFSQLQYTQIDYAVMHYFTLISGRKGSTLNIL